MIEANKHLVTIIYSSIDERIDGEILYGDDLKGYNHSEAIFHIEDDMYGKYKMPPLAPKYMLSQEKIRLHNIHGNIVICNLEKESENAKLWIYIPAKIDEKKMQLIKEFISENLEHVLFIFKYENDSEIIIPIEDFLHNKTKHFTIIRQNH